MRKPALIVVLLLPLAACAQGDPPHEPIPVLRQRLDAASNDTARLHATLLLAAAYIDEQDDAGHNARHGLDTGLVLLAQVEKSDALRTSRYLQGLFHYTYSDALAEQGKRDSSIQQALLAIHLLPPATIDWAKACVQLGYNYTHNDPEQDSIRSFWFQKALPVLAAGGTTDSKFWHAHTLMCLAQYNRLRPEESMKLYQRSLDIYRSVGQQDLRVLYSEMSTTCASMGNHKQALEYTMLAVQQDEVRPKPDEFSINVYDQLGYWYYQQGKAKEAIPHFRKAFRLAIELKDTNNIPQLASNLVLAYGNAGDYEGGLQVRREASVASPPRTLEQRVLDADGYASIFRKMHRPDSMQPYVQRLIKLDARIPRDAHIRFHTLMMPLAWFNMVHQYGKAREYGIEQVRLGNLLGLMNAVAFGYRELSIADSALGNYQASMQDYKKYIRLQDSIRDAGNASQLAGLKLQYETEKKDKDIEALNHKQQISNLALHQAATTRNFIIAGAILLLVLLLLAVNRYRLKQRSNRQLSRLLTEKDWLLKEIHHRVKNNLQIGMSLLNLQSHYIENEKAQSAIRESRSRMYAMSLIHQRLYQADNLKTIDMQQYIPQLAECIRDSYAGEKEIDFQLHIQPLELDVEQALPIGLIINEALTNSLKYAFPGRRSGRIGIGLENVGGKITLALNDDGIGLPAGFNPPHERSMGMQLIDILVQQLDGDINITNQGGLAITIRFPLHHSPAQLQKHSSSRQPANV